LSKLEMRWLDRLSRAADALPEEEAALLAQLLPQIDRSKVHLEEYEVTV
jgi:hypothetical protein